jgi:hypothetical protein
LWPSRSRLPLLRWRSIIEGNDMKKALIAIIIGVGIAAPLAATRDLPAPAPSAAELRPAWTEYKWPFPVDQWGIGRAFVCMPVECGVEVNLYLRPKIGFCRCATGVDDDDELERIGDAGLLDTRAAPISAGHAVEVAWMNGRIRPYGVSGSAQERILSIAFNDRCDVMVAVAALGRGDPGPLEPAVIAFLNSERVLRWVRWLIA